MSLDLLAYAMYNLGEGYSDEAYNRNEMTHREELLCYNDLKSVPLKLTTSVYDDYRDELILELEEKRGKRKIFTFYEETAREWFLIEMGVRSFEELSELDGKANLEGIFHERGLLWISAYDPSHERGEKREEIIKQKNINENFSFLKRVRDELNYLREKDLAKPLEVKNIEKSFIRESDRVHELFMRIKKGMLGSYSLGKLIDSKEKLEDSFDESVGQLGKCAGILNQEDFSSPNSDKYFEFVNGVMIELEREIELREEGY